MNFNDLGTDLILNAVRAAVGDKIEGIDKDPQYSGAWAEVILHSKKDGVLKEIKIDSEFERKYVIEKDYWVKKGDIVHKFTGANFTLGTIILNFENQETLLKYIQCIDDYVKIELEE